MNDIRKQILDKIKSYQKIVITRHSRPDGDAVGSTKGLQRILQTSFPDKAVYLINDDYAEYTAFLGAEDPQMPDGFYADALVIVLDTGNADRISNRKYSRGKEIVRIDHHIDDTPFGDLSLADATATYLYCGMVTDTDRFRYIKSGRTMRVAAELLDRGIDLERLHAHLYLDGADALDRQALFIRRIRMTAHGVAYLTVTRAMQEKYGITSEEASTAVDVMNAIRGSLIWIAFIEQQDGTSRVRLRSRFLDIHDIAARYHGGGHAKAAGATIRTKGEKAALLAEADEKLAKYKESHEDCI